MPRVDNFTAYFLSTPDGATEDGSTYATEYPLPKKTPPAASNFYSRSMIESIWDASYRIMVGMIDPHASLTDLIIYVLVDGNLIASRILRNREGESSDVVTGMSLNDNGFGPLQLLPKEESGLHFAQALPPSSSGEIKLLVYRGQAVPCEEPSLFSYPSFVCPFVLCRNPLASGPLEVEGITGFGAPRPFEGPPPEKRFNFISDDPWPAPHIVISFLTCSPLQIRSHLEVSRRLARAGAGKPSQRYADEDFAISPNRQRTTSLAELNTLHSPSSSTNHHIVRSIPVYRDSPFISSCPSQPQSSQHQPQPSSRSGSSRRAGQTTLLSAPIFSPEDQPPLFSTDRVPLSAKSSNVIAGNASNSADKRLTTLLSRKRMVDEMEGSQENERSRGDREGKKGKSRE